jgi:uncharacterized membrane protein
MTTETTLPAEDGAPRVFALVCYGLLLLACTNGLTAVVAVVLAYIKRDDVRGTPFESHFSNVITVFWASVAFVVAFIAAAGLGVITVFGTAHGNHPDVSSMPPLIGFAVAVWLGCVSFAVWYLYRTIKGFIRALDGRAY